MMDTTHKQSKLSYKFWQPCFYKILSAYEIGENLREKIKQGSLNKLFLNLAKIARIKSARPGEYSRLAYCIDKQNIIYTGKFCISQPKISNAIKDNMPQGLCTKPSLNSPIDTGEEYSSMISMLEPAVKVRERLSNQELSEAHLILLNSGQLRNLAQSADKSPAYIEQLLKYKKKLNHFYWERISVPLEFIQLDSKKIKLSATVSTKPYFPIHIIINSSTCRTDIQYLKHAYLKSSTVKSVGKPQAIKTTDDLPPKAELDLATVNSIIDDIKKSYAPNEHKDNNTDIELISLLLREMGPGSILAQNSLDACSAANHFHLHFTIQSQEFTFPIFDTEYPSLLKQVSYQVGSENCNLSFYRLTGYPGSVYKIKTNYISDKLIIFLKYLVKDFLSSTDNEHSLITMVTRIDAEGEFEYYFMLRKDYRFYKALEKQVYMFAVGRNAQQTEILFNRKLGWVEYAGLMLQADPSIKYSLDDLEYYQLIDLHQVAKSQTLLFEQIFTACQSILTEVRADKDLDNTMSSPALG